MTPDATTLHFLKAIEAAPADRVVRFALSDHLRESGHEAWADAVLATADRVPEPNPVRKHVPPWTGFGWACGYPRKSAELSDQLFEALTVKTDGWVYWRFYPTFAAALLDLWRAWVAVHREGVTV